MKLKKILLSTLCAVAIMFGTLAPATSTMAAESQVIEIDDIEQKIRYAIPFLYEVQCH
ncbi:MAG: hypothetical protein UH654_09610 [Lachnospiraceae bacterium]|nr:hypothetical protein [Lachnospiraceae bacterium]